MTSATTPFQRSALAVMTHARNQYRRVPLPVRRLVDRAMGTGIYKPAMTKHGALFTHVPKSAGTSISSALFGIPCVGHYTATEARSYDPIQFQELFKFAFVRHPVSRAVSAYRYLSTGGTKDVPVSFPDRYAHIASLTFGEFIDWLTTIDVQQWNPVLHKQACYVCDESGRTLVDFLGRFENISDDFAFICSHLGIAGKLAQRNASMSNGTQVNDKGIERRIASIYYDDFEVLGYHD